MNEQLNKLKELLLSDDTNIEYTHYDRKMKCLWLSVSDKSNPDSSYFYLSCNPGETSVRAMYKLPGMENEISIVIDILVSSIHCIKIMIRRLEKLEIEYQIATE